MKFVKQVDENAINDPTYIKVNRKAPSSSCFVFKNFLVDFFIKAAHIW